MKHPGGRPLKFKTVKELQAKIDAYFAARTEMNLPFTITGLALALDTTRETLLDYEGREQFSDTVKWAKLRCQDYAEVQLFTGKNQAGAMFSLKNFGWRDKQEVDHTTGGKPLYLPSEILTKNGLGDPQSRPGGDRS
jgi:hypothetical protein